MVKFLKVGARAALGVSGCSAACLGWRRRAHPAPFSGVGMRRAGGAAAAGRVRWAGLRVVRVEWFGASFPTRNTLRRNAAPNPASAAKTPRGWVQRGRGHGAASPQALGYRAVRPTQPAGRGGSDSGWPHSCPRWIGRCGGICRASEGSVARVGTPALRRAAQIRCCVQGCRISRCCCVGGGVRAIGVWVLRVVAGGAAEGGRGYGQHHGCSFSGPAARCGCAGVAGRPGRWPLIDPGGGRTGPEEGRSAARLLHTCRPGASAQPPRRRALGPGLGWPGFRVCRKEEGATAG